MDTTGRVTRSVASIVAGQRVDGGRMVCSTNPANLDDVVAEAWLGGA
jgi:hypothetical protein